MLGRQVLQIQDQFFSPLPLSPLKSCFQVSAHSRVSSQACQSTLLCAERCATWAFHFRKEEAVKKTVQRIQRLTEGRSGRPWALMILSTRTALLDHNTLLFPWNSRKAIPVFPCPSFHCCPLWGDFTRQPQHWANSGFHEENTGPFRPASLHSNCKRENTLCGVVVCASSSQQWWVLTPHTWQAVPFSERMNCSVSAQLA